MTTTQTTQTTDLAVADMILAQLGGRRFSAMTGARDFLGGPDALQFSIPRNASKANKVRIVLAGDDTYTVEFWSVRRHGLDCRQVYGLAGVYCDQLREIFEAQTGLRTSL